jgi:hypothetical protein
MVYLTTKEACEKLTLIFKTKIGVRTIQQQCQNGYIKNIIKNGCYFIAEEDVKNYKIKRRGRPRKDY